jgi:hypothetical protein
MTRQVTYTITFEVKDGHLVESLGHWPEVFDGAVKCLRDTCHFEIQSRVTEYVQKRFPFVRVVRLDPTTTS